MARLKNRIYRLGFPLSLLLLVSCSGNQRIYEEYKELPNMNWNRFNVVKFEVPVEDITVPYDITLAIRHIPEIPYKEMNFNITMYSPSGDMRSMDYTLDLVDQEGKPLSDCMGDLCDITLPLRTGFSFGEAGKAIIEIENKYDKVQMPGILEVGLIVKKSRDK